MLIRWLCLIFLLSLVQRITCQDDDIYLLDEISYLKQRIGFCLNHFQYIQADGFIIGKLTVPKMKIGDTVKMEFYYREGPRANMRFKGSLLPDEHPLDLINKVQKGQPITYRVDFQVGYEPELKNIFINDNELCGTILIVSGEKLVLQHTLEITNDSLPVFTYNINIPHFTQVNNCGLIDKEIARNALKKYIKGDTVVRRGEYPWLTAIYKNDTTGRTFICGGSLITSEIILTAAHCFQGLTAKDIFIELGRYNLTDSEEDSTVVREIKDVILHPEYMPVLSFSDTDLALLKMKEPVSFTQFIKPICLWSEPPDEALIVGRAGAVAGWGADENGNAISAVPKKVKTKIVSKTECQRSSPVYTALTSTSTLCAGNGDDTGPCEGDSGGGLMLYRNGLWTLRGVISAGLTNQQSCNTQQYTVYCDIAKHTTWLDNYIGQQEQLIYGAVNDICGESGSESRSKYPWLTAIYVKQLTGLLYSCTGTLISASSVLTPASCFDTKNGGVEASTNLKIFLGRYDLNSINENGVVRRDVENLIRHPNYEQTGGLFYENDVAILQLNAPVSFTQYIKPICLWSEPADQTQIVGQSVTLLSWNKLKIFDETSTEPQSMEVDVVPLDQCQLSGFGVTTSSSFFCTPRFGNNAEGILMLKRNGRWLLRGISSANSNFFERYNSAEYRLYSDIAEYQTWIESNMSS